MAGAADHLEKVALTAQSSATARAAAEAMAMAMRAATARYIGADLTLSRLRAGPVEINPRGDQGRAAVDISGAAFTIADKGRRTARPASAGRGSALSTPWGPRRSVRGSTSAGKDIMGRSASEVFNAGAAAATAAIQGMR